MAEHRVTVLQWLIVLAMTAALIVGLGWLAGTLLDRHSRADRCRAAGYLWLGGYVDAHEERP